MDTKSLTAAAQMQETTQMLMQPNANWEAYLTPAPLSIAILGELIFISSCDDFSINKNPPPGGFKYIRYPDSFRACLMQICNSGWHAFNEAHKNMDQIRIHTSTVPDSMKAAVYILFNASDKVINTLLPNQLKNLRTIVDNCVTLADSVENEFSDVINLIQDLLEACVNAEYFYGDELEKVKMKLEEIKFRQQEATDLNVMMKMLVKGLDTMGRVKEQWEKMVRFFQMVSCIIKTSLSKTLHNFVETSDGAKKLSYSQKLFTKDLLYNQAFQASNIASLVHMISGTYTEVSNKYLMDLMSSLGRFPYEPLKLQDSCKAAQEGILQLVLKNKKEFERKSNARMLKIEGELKAILPAHPPQETERIREIVQAGFEGEDDYC
ncbi:uncharacterized protein [Trachinotus anak]|uniref:uncharacterized protein n=1 Tax=Trachinotus anak TaxID=443729 RepID=UPI0039F1E419